MPSTKGREAETIKMVVNREMNERMVVSCMIDKYRPSEEEESDLLERSKVQSCSDRTATIVFSLYHG